MDIRIPQIPHRTDTETIEWHPRRQWEVPYHHSHVHNTAAVKVSVVTVVSVATVVKVSVVTVVSVATAVTVVTADVLTMNSNRHNLKCRRQGLVDTLSKASLNDRVATLRASANSTSLWAIAHTWGLWDIQIIWDRELQCLQGCRDEILPVEGQRLV
jgi:hypothetical protein